MKKLVLSNLLAFAFITVFAQVKMPAPSPTQIIKQDFGVGNIEVKYSRPSAKGRKVFGELVPYNKLWRTGANSATVIRFSEPVEINGKKIDTGSYALYSIPNVDYWDVILNKGISNSGVNGYMEADDVARCSLTCSGTKISTSASGRTAMRLAISEKYRDTPPKACMLNAWWS